MGAKAKVFLNFVGGTHPEDSVVILSGLIDDARFGAGNVELQVSHPDQLKRAEIFPQIIDQLASGIDDTVTTIPLLSTDGIIEPHDIVTSFVRIDDEIIQIGSISGTDLIDCVRGASVGATNTVATPHDVEAEVTTIYNFTSDPIDLALKMLMSNPQEPNYVSGVDVDFFGRDANGNLISNAIFYVNADLERDQGITVGDFITTEGALNPANNPINCCCAFS